MNRLFQLIVGNIFQKVTKFSAQRYQWLVLCDRVHEGSFCYYFLSGMHLKSNIVECLTKEGK